MLPDSTLDSSPTLSPMSAGGGARTSTGMRHLVAAAFYFSAMGVLVKVAGARLPSSQIALVRAVVCLILSWLWLRQAGVAPWGSNPKMLVLRGLFGTVGLVSFYYSLVTL